MSKTGRKWLKTNWSDSDCVRAQDIPYDEENSIKDKIDDVYTKDEVDILLGGSGGSSSMSIDDIMMYT